MPTRAVARTGAALPVRYASFLNGLKGRIRAAQVKVVLAVNAELVLLCWHVGRDILARQEQEGWGARGIERLSADLHAAFPEMKGFSPRNLKYMRAFAEAWPEPEIVQPVAAQLPWFHSCTLLDRVKGKSVREWYARQTIEHGWSRNVLLAQLETRLHERAGKVLTNFKGTHAPSHSDLAQQAPMPPQARQRERSRGAVLALAILATASGASAEGCSGHSCTGLGCQPAADVVFSHALDSSRTYQVDVVSNGVTTSCRVSLTAVDACSIQPIWTGSQPTVTLDGTHLPTGGFAGLTVQGQPTSMAVTISDGTGVVATARFDSIHYSAVEINGAGCGTCSLASVAMSVP